jgi:hypothetical protein
MSMATGRNSCLNRFRETSPQGRVWSAAIVVGNEFTKDALQMPLVQRNQIVQALAPNTANHPLAISIGDRRLLHLKVTLRRDVSG